MLGFAWLTPICRGALVAARRIVPQESLATWTDAWQSDYWHWLLKSDAHRSSDGRSALLAHTLDGFRAAISAARGNAENIRRSELITGHPAFPLGVLGVAILGIILWSGLIPETRRLISPPTQPSGNNLVLVSQSGKFLAARRGFTKNETERFAQKSTRLVGIAAQEWYKPKVVGDGITRVVTASNVGARFFDVLGVKAGFGALPSADDEFAASFDFWQDGLQSPALGKSYRIAGRRLRLTGVLPREFLFLSPIAVWTAQSFEPPALEDPRLQRWHGLKGVIARVKPGVSTAAVEKELFEIEVARSMGHFTQQVHAEPYATYTARIPLIYGGGLIGALTLAFLAAVVAFVRDKHSGAARASALRYWGLLLAKVAMSVMLCFLFVMENTGVSDQGLLGGVWFGRDLFAIWLFFCGAAMLTFWAWRDQSSRCRVCLHRLRDPIRIGIPGQVLLETAGLELMCPKGHGIIYTSESVLGSEMSDHWLGLEEPAEP